MAKKINIGVIFGGKSSEHEISILSASNIVKALNRKKYNIVLIYIDRDGEWYKISENDILEPSKNLHKKITFSPKILRSVDVVFPVLHGTNGEDGTIQGLLKLANVKFVGASVLGSSVGMDKDIMKRLLRDARIRIPKFLAFKKNDSINFDEIEKTLGLPMFVKPANNGSSIGVSKIKSKNDLPKAVKDAFMFDNKILIEEAIVGQEIECSVLGNDNPIASIPGEIISKHEFYSYEAKYIDPEGATTEIPARLSKTITSDVQKTAIEAFKALGCEGMARVDMFVTKNGEIYLNEINTIPGFTNISMYPKMWEASGISYSELIDKLIELAIDRFKSESALQTTYS